MLVAMIWLNKVIIWKRKNKPWLHTIQYPVAPILQNFIIWGSASYLPKSSCTLIISSSSLGFSASVCCHISATIPQLSRPTNLCLSPCFNRTISPKSNEEVSFCSSVSLVTTAAVPPISFHISARRLWYCQLNLFPGATIKILGLSLPEIFNSSFVSPKKYWSISLYRFHQSQKIRPRAGYCPVY